MPVGLWLMSFPYESNVLEVNLLRGLVVLIGEKGMPMDSHQLWLPRLNWMRVMTRANLHLNVQGLWLLTTYI
jgi:hypothetical protein